MFNPKIYKILDLVSLETLLLWQSREMSAAL